MVVAEFISTLQQGLPHGVYPERDSSVAEFILSEAEVLRMTGSEGFRASAHTLRMTRSPPKNFRSCLIYQAQSPNKLGCEIASLRSQ